jgi:hypothetical protein
MNRNVQIFEIYESKKFYHCTGSHLVWKDKKQNKNKNKTKTKTKKHRNSYGNVAVHYLVVFQPTALLSGAATFLRSKKSLNQTKILQRLCKAKCHCTWF